MITYIIRRSLTSMVVLFIVTLIVFFIMQLLPGDPLIIFMGKAAGTGAYSPEEIEKLYIHYGLDKPLIVQYLNWLSGVFQGSLGESIYYHDKVSSLLLERLPPTIDLGIKSFIIYNILGILTGLLGAMRRGTWKDNLATLFSYIGISIPVFWLGLILIYIFGLRLDWFPIAGYTLPTDDLSNNIHQTVLPVICLSLMGWAVIARQTRSSMLEVISQDYIRTAWSKGLTERAIIMKHVLKNGFIPIITLMGIMIGLMLGGQVFVEEVFAIPGIGRLLVTSVFDQDYLVVQSITLLIATIVILVNLIVDISYGWFDPRIRYG